MTPVARVGGRALLIDPDGLVLLIHERVDDGGTHWLTPGGGVEDGEHPRHAAVRETFEETGIRVALPDDAEAVLVTRRLWSWAGVVYDQEDHFFTARVAAGLDVVPGGLTDLERQTVLGHRWWSVPELASTPARVVPEGLAGVLAGLIRGPGA